MKKKNTIGKFALVAVLAAGLSAPVFAQDPNRAPPVPQSGSQSQWSDGSYTPSSSDGMLGSNYTELDYTYVHHVSGLPKKLNSYGLLYNQSVQPGLDVGFAYNWIGGSEAGIRARQQEATINATYFIPQSWGRPFVSADAGWIWQKFAGEKANTFTYKLATGVEFQLIPALVLTPYVSYQGTPSHFSDDNFLWHNHGRLWSAGAKATYRVTKQWGASLGAEISEHNDIGYTAGVSYHF